MSQKYAKDQPAGFTNRIERVAIVGVSSSWPVHRSHARILTMRTQAGGQVGGHLAKALVKTGKHVITAITRKSSTNKMPEGVKAAPVDYDDESTLVEALRGQQFLIITMKSFAPKDSQSKLISAAAKAGVPWVMPNAYSPDIVGDAAAEETLVAPIVNAAIRAVEEAGVSSWVALICSYWYQWSFALKPDWFGFDLVEKKVTFFDDGKTLINTSTWEQCGRAVAGFLSLKELPEDEHDTEPSMSGWRNKPLYISSFLVSQRDILDSLHRVMGTSDADWEIEHEKSVDRYQRALGLMKDGYPMGWAMAMYVRTFYPGGHGNFEKRHGLANEVLGLPVEDLDEQTKIGVDMKLGGYKSYFD